VLCPVFFICAVLSIYCFCSAVFMVSSFMNVCEKVFKGWMHMITEHGICCCEVDAMFYSQHTHPGCYCETDSSMSETSMKLPLPSALISNNCNSLFCWLYWHHFRPFVLFCYRASQVIIQNNTDKNVFLHWNLETGSCTSLTVLVVCSPL
jgi:hypothetical protein